MTEKEIEMARYIKDNILPKLQEIQRDLYMDEHLTMSIEENGFKMGITVFVFVREGQNPLADIICTGQFRFSTFLVSKSQKTENDKALRGIQHFVKNWQERLG